MRLLILVLVVVLLVECAKKEEKGKDAKKEGKGKDAMKEMNAKDVKKEEKGTDSKKTETKKKETKKRTGKKFWFKGKDQWVEHSLDLCFKETPLPNDYLCYKYYRNYEVVYIDPVSANPIILVYRRFIPQKFVDDFLSDVERKQKRMKEKKKEDEFMKPYLDKYTRRRANETIVSHDSMSGVARVFRRAQSLIPMLNFSISGPWQVLSYKRGGHQAPHYDYITYSSPDQFSKTTREYGNRFITFALTLKTADVGGATTFIFLNQTVRTSPGDVILFHNINKDMTPTNAVAHGECPVEEGEKITATLWLRPKGQELFNSYPQDDQLFPYDMEKLIAPNMDFYRMSPYYDLYYFQQQMMQSYAEAFAQQQKEAEGKKK